MTLNIADRNGSDSLNNATTGASHQRVATAARAASVSEKDGSKLA